MWDKQWNEAIVAFEKPCRGCLSLLVLHKSGNFHTQIKRLAVSREVRRTSAGYYCEECFKALQRCSKCRVEPVSHSEYPCPSCENKGDLLTHSLSGGRSHSPTYRGWSCIYEGKGQNNGRKRDRKKPCSKEAQ
jgi:hypothetical protein